jgi:Caspase domain/Bacterial Ig domain
VGGEDLIGWHVNRGWAQEADFFPASQFRAQYNRPDIVKLVLRTRDEAESIRQANAAAEREVAKPIAAALPPVVTIKSPVDGAYFSGGTVDITYTLRSPSDLPVDKLDVLADGQPIASTGFKAMSSREGQGHIVASPPRKDATLSLIAHSGALPSAAASVKLLCDGPSEIGPKVAELAAEPKPKLYVLLVGVTGYPKPQYDEDLKFPARDVVSLADAFKAQKGGLYDEVPTRIVDVPSRDNVMDGLYWLQGVATGHDLSVVYLSGHGYRDGKLNFWFLARDSDYKRLQKSAISDSALFDLLSSVQGKKVLFLDACHAGAVKTQGAKGLSESDPDMNSVVNEFAKAGSGAVVYGASTGSELALEDEKWDRHSAYAKALIEAIGEGKAKSGANGPITTDRLQVYLDERVKDLTGGAQHPVMNRSGLIPDFPIALANP